MNYKLLKQKDFGLLMTCKLFSLIGTQIQDFALSLYVLKITGSAAVFASILAVTIVPQLILGPISGVFTDWLDRKKMIIYLDLFQGILVAGFGCVYLINGHLSLFSIYVIVILLSLSSVIYQPASSTIMPTIVNKDDLLDANAISTFIMKAGTLIAPALAGVIFGFWGIFAVFIINSVSFLLSALLEVFINLPRANKRPKKIDLKTFTADFKEGLTFIKSKRLIYGIILIAVVINGLGDPVFSIGVIYITKKILQVSDFQYGLVQSVFVTSMLIAPILSSIVANKMKLSKIIFLDILALSLLIVILAIVPFQPFISLFKSSLPPYITFLAVIFIIGLVTTTANIALSTYFQREVPLEMMGRVGTVMNSVCMAAIPLGQLTFGLLYDKIPTYVCVLIPGVLLFFYSIIFIKRLYKYDKETIPDSICKDTDFVNA